MLAGMDLHDGGRPKTGSPTEPVSPRLQDLGIDKKTSHLWRRVLAAPEGVFDGYLGGDDEITLAGLLRAAKADSWCPPERVTGETCTTDDLWSLVKDGKKFGVIYADPLWTFEVYSGKGKSRSAERHYDTLTLDQIKDTETMPVPDLAADDCALFLWAVMPQLPEALAVVPVSLAIGSLLDCPRCPGSAVQQPLQTSTGSPRLSQPGP